MIEFVFRSPLHFGLVSLGMGAGLVAMGVVVFIGARNRWLWLVDPPKHAWFWYVPAFIKVVAGTSLLQVWTYVFGGLCIVAGLLNIFAGVGALISHAR